MRCSDYKLQVGVVYTSRGMLMECHYLNLPGSSTNDFF
jgi:hypothetical protein